MCGRYYIAEDDVQEELMAIIAEVNRRHNPSDQETKLKTHGEVFPTDIVPIIANNRSLIPTPFAMKWGYKLPNINRPIINARSEEATEKPLFKNGMLERRCLVPASGYFEWEKRGKKKVKYAIMSTGKNAVYMAGIYRIEDGQPVFTILTREVAPNIAFIHDRMPVILPKAARRDWLNPKYAADDVIRDAVLDVEYDVDVEGL